MYKKDKTVIFPAIQYARYDLYSVIKDFVTLTQNVIQTFLFLELYMRELIPQICIHGQKITHTKFNLPKILSTSIFYFHKQ